MVLLLRFPQDAKFCAEPLLTLHIPQFPARLLHSMGSREEGTLSLRLYRAGLAEGSDHLVRILAVSTVFMYPGSGSAACSSYANNSKDCDNLGRSWTHVQRSTLKILLSQDSF